MPKRLQGFQKGHKGFLTKKHYKIIAEKNSIALLGNKNGLGRVINEETRKQLSKQKVGNRNPAWRGGKSLTKKGYLFVKNLKHPYANGRGYVFEHRLVIEKILGRYLMPQEECHHINKIRIDNRVKNLMAFSNHSVHEDFENNRDVLLSDIVFDGRQYGRKTVSCSTN